MSRMKIYHLVLVLLIVAYTTMFYPLAIGPYNGLVLLAMIVCCVLTSLNFCICKSEIPLYVLLFVILGGSLIHYETFRVVSLVYSAGFLLSLICFMRLLKFQALTASQYLFLIDRIICAYAIVLIFQQLCTLAGLPAFNRCWFFPNPFKLNSLAQEPSYVGGTLILLFYSHIKVWGRLNGGENYKKDFLRNKWIWFAFFYTLFSNGSSWSLFAGIFMVLYLLRRKKKWLCFMFVVAVGLLFFTNFSEKEAAQRLLKFIPAIFTGNTEYISSVDLSASARINPVFYYFQDINLFSKNFWFGYGMDYSRSTVLSRLLGTAASVEDGYATGGLFPAFFWDFGALSGCIFLWCLKKYAVQKWLSFPFLIWIFFFLPMWFNTYMTWMFFIICFVTAYFDFQNQKVLRSFND